MSSVICSLVYGVRMRGDPSETSESWITHSKFLSVVEQALPTEPVQTMVPVSAAGLDAHNHILSRV